MDADLYKMTYFVTFFSHFGAVRYKGLCTEQHIACRMMPVPRDLSSSCGTCVRYEGETACPADIWPQEVEQVVQALPEGYRTCYRAENS